MAARRVLLPEPGVAHIEKYLYSGLAMASAGGGSGSYRRGIPRLDIV